MPLRDRSARAILLALAAGALLAALACASGPSGSKPVAALASTPAAAAAFDAIREAWRKTPRSNLPTLRSPIEQFIAQYPRDGLVPFARVLLALVALEQQDAVTADRQLSLGESLPPGSTRDLWTVACARRLRLRGRPNAALALLHPLVGKNVEPMTRAQFEEELTLAALTTRRDYEAISYMDAWLRASSEEDRAQTVATVTSLVQRLSKEVLVGALQAMRAQRATALGYGADIERILAERLVRIATTSGDAELARLLLDPDAGALVVAGEAGAVLGELATSRRGLNVVEGRTVGLLLPTESPGLRDESADVLRGVMWGLGLPRGVRTLARAGDAPVAGGSASSRGASSEPPRGTCAPAEPAPELDDPTPDEQLRLATRDDAGRADRTEVSLDELAGEGATIVVAGLDPVTATRALRWGENHGVVVVALVPPSEPLPSAGFGFVLGEARSAVIEALARNAPALASEGVTPVVDASEVESYPLEGGRSGPLTLLPPVSCDIVPVRAGDPRFPVTQWDRDKRRVWLVTGSAACARDVAQELSTANAHGLMALTLESASTPRHAAGLRVVSASAGVVPQSSADDPRARERQRFEVTLGTVSWWSALGRDAATLARTAIRQLPLESVSDPREVSARRARARDLFATSHARLWTTEKAGWMGDHSMKRTVCAVDVPTPAMR
jgi:hypothetical protein